MENLPSNASRAYQELADLPKYQHFVRIPDRIIQCVNYFGIACDHASARTRLHAYYLFIGVVDDAIDSGRIDAGSLVLDCLSTPCPVFGEAVRRSSVNLIIEVLKCNIRGAVYPLMMNKLKALYREVVSERGATSIDSYIEHRKTVGSLTAELSYVLIQPDMHVEHEGLLEFMKQVGAVGCLVDSLIDLNADRRFGLLAFRPRPSDYTKLIACILSDGARVSLKHPRLCGLFLRAIGDNVRDRFRADANVARESIVSDRKGTAPGVA
jgi:hypothetical protein